MDTNQSTIIESIGTYLPPETFSTAGVLQGCKNKIQFPLEKITGIKTRRMAGETEFSIHMARKAVDDCLEKSKYDATDIDLLICCNISRWDDPGSISFEPGTSIRLKREFGFTGALAFDITNACAGMFTGIYIVNAFLRAGTIRRGMVVSGEYITHLTQAAQREIESFMDTRLACLTLGDAAAALILENTTNNQTGFREFDLRTFGKYSPYCVAKVSEHSGMIMYTDPLNLTDTAIKSGAKHAIDTLDKAGWSTEQFQHLIMHQTSTMTLNSARREINRLMKTGVCHDGNTINNLEHRGNTASTSHFITIADQIRNNNINSGDKIVFSISASGLTTGTALYTFDDLPERLRQIESKKTDQQPGYINRKMQYVSSPVSIPLRIESMGTTQVPDNENHNSMDLLKTASANCLNNSAYKTNEIDLLIYSGVYRSEYVMEPAYAALLAGELDMNATTPSNEDNKTLAFDVFNGSVGFLNSCYVAQQMIAAGNCKTAMIVAAECENNAQSRSEQRIEVSEIASAFVLDKHPCAGKGFSRFLFGYDLDSLESYTTSYKALDTNPHLHIEKNKDLNKQYINCMVPAVQELLNIENLDLEKIDIIFPPQVSSAFISELSRALNISKEKCIDAVGKGPDLFSSSLPFAMEYAYKNKLVKPGSIGLMITAGSGLQVGCAIYHF